MIYPETFKTREPINSLTGIKSSLGNIRKVVSLTYLLYLANGRKPNVNYSVSNDNKSLTLKSEYEDYISNFLGNEVINDLKDNPLLTSQIESLYVGITLMFGLGKVSFANQNLSMTVERTGGIRYPKVIGFASNIIILDLILSSIPESKLKSFLTAWIKDQHTNDDIEDKVSTFLNITIENNLFKLRRAGNDIYFQTEGLYKSILKDEVSLETDEVVGPTRIFNSMLREDLIPWLSYKKSTVNKSNNSSFDIQAYSDIVSNSLDIRNIKIDEANNQFSSNSFETSEDKKSDLIYQTIFYGAPGTGKSHAISDKTQGESVIRTTFHPDSDYSTFVGAYKPTTKEVELRDVSGHKIYEGGKVVVEDRIVYEFVEQAFLQAYVQAWQYYVADSEEPKKQFLVIEEINRGNCAQIFGDLFQLLDRNDWGFSDYPIKADKDMKKQLAKAFKDLSIDNPDAINAQYKGRDVVSEVLFGDILLLPNNLYIWATMNTSDQSLFPIDSAFKRRWEWQYMPIAKGCDQYGKDLRWGIKVGNKLYDWWSFLEKINAQVGEQTQSEDKKLGFFFCKAKDNVISLETFVGKVVFYLWNDVFKDYDFEGSIFNDIDNTKLSYNKFYTTDGNGNAVIRADKAELFLNNLEVALLGETVEEELPEEDEDGYTDSSTGRNYDKYSVNGVGSYGKNNLATECVKKYIELNPDKSIDEVLATWKSLGNIVSHFIESKDEYDARTDNSKRSNEISCGGSVLYVAHNGYGSNGKVVVLQNEVNRRNWGITIEKV
jgi:hypothetical protein